MANTGAKVSRLGRKPAADTRTINEHAYTDATVPPMPSTEDYGLSTWNANTAEFEPVNEWPVFCQKLWEGMWTFPVRGALLGADTHAAEMVIRHLTQTPQAKPGDKLKGSAAYEGAERSWSDPGRQG